MDLTLRQLQQEQRAWVAHNFPGRHEYYPLLGAVEELGELAHAHLKGLQGIRGTTEGHAAKKRDAIGDVIIFLCDYCSANGIDIQDALETTWTEVRKRDWVSDPLNGNPQSSAPLAPLRETTVAVSAPSLSRPEMIPLVAFVAAVQTYTLAQVTRGHLDDEQALEIFCAATRVNPDRLQALELEAQARQFVNHLAGRLSERPGWLR